MNNLSCNLINLEKEELIKPKVSQRQEIQSRAENNETENF